MERAFKLYQSNSEHASLFLKNGKHPDAVKASIDAFLQSHDAEMHLGPLFAQTAERQSADLACCVLNAVKHADSTAFRAFYTFLTDRGLLANDQVVSETLKLLLRFNMKVETADFFNSLSEECLRQLEPHRAILLMRCLIECGMNQEALHVVHFTASRVHRFPRQLIVALHENFVADKNFLQCHKLFDVLRQRSTHSLTTSYLGRVMHAACREPHVEVAQPFIERVIDTVLKAKIPLSCKYFNLAISYFVRRRRLNTAVALVEKLIHSNTHFPDGIILMSLIFEFLSMDDLNHAAYWLKKMNEFNFKPNIKLYTKFISRLARHGNINAVETCLHDMKLHGLSMDLQTYTTVMSAHASMGDLDRVERLFFEMIEQGIQPDLVLCQNVVKGCLRSGETEKALALVDGLSRAPRLTKAHQDMFHLVANELLEHKEHALAGRYLSKLEGVELDSNSRIICMQIKLRSRQSNSPEQLMQFTKNKSLNTGVEVDALTLGALLDAIEPSHSLKSVSDIGNLMETHAKKMNLWRWACLVRLYCERGAYMKALGVWKRHAASRTLPAGSSFDLKAYNDMLALLTGMNVAKGNGEFAESICTGLASVSEAKLGVLLNCEAWSSLLPFFTAATKNGHAKHACACIKTYLSYLLKAHVMAGHSCHPKSPKQPGALADVLMAQFHWQVSTAMGVVPLDDLKSLVENLSEDKELCRELLTLIGKLEQIVAEHNSDDIK